MSDIKIYSVAKMTVRDGFISGEGGILIPYYQELKSKETTPTKHQNIFDKIKIVFQVLTGKYALVVFENEKKEF